MRIRKPFLFFLALTLAALFANTEPAKAFPPIPERTYAYGGDVFCSGFLCSNPYSLCLDAVQNSNGYQALSDTCSTAATQGITYSWADPNQGNDFYITQVIGGTTYYLTAIFTGSLAGYVYWETYNGTSDQTWLGPRSNRGTVTTTNSGV